MRISDWSSDVCSSDLLVIAIDRDRRPGDGRLDRPRRGDLDIIGRARLDRRGAHRCRRRRGDRRFGMGGGRKEGGQAGGGQQGLAHRSEEQTSELQSLMRISYAVFCLKKKNIEIQQEYQYTI